MRRDSIYDKTRAVLAAAAALVRVPFHDVGMDMDQAPEATAETSRSWLSDRITWLRGQWSGMNFPLPAGLIHGDADISNLMRAVSGEAILGDWDHVTIGPREWDLIQIHYMHPMLGRTDGDGLE